MIFNNEDIIYNIIEILLNEKKNNENIVECENLNKKKNMKKYYLVNKTFNNVLNFEIPSCIPKFNNFNNLIYCNTHTRNITKDIIETLDIHYFNELDYIKSLNKINISNVSDNNDIIYVHFIENIYENVEFDELTQKLCRIYNFTIMGKCCNGSGLIISYKTI